MCLASATSHRTVRARGPASALEAYRSRMTSMMPGSMSVMTRWAKSKSRHTSCPMLDPPHPTSRTVPSRCDADALARKGAAKGRTSSQEQCHSRLC